MGPLPGGTPCRNGSPGSVRGSRAARRWHPGGRARSAAPWMESFFCRRVKKPLLDGEFSRRTSLDLRDRSLDRSDPHSIDFIKGASRWVAFVLARARPAGCRRGQPNFETPHGWRRSGCPPWARGCPSWARRARTRAGPAGSSWFARPSSSAGATRRRAPEAHTPDLLDTSFNYIRTKVDISTLRLCSCYSSSRLAGMP